MRATYCRRRNEHGEPEHAPYVPGSTLEQGAMARAGQGWSADYLGAVMLGSHVTFFSDRTRFSEDEIATAAGWSSTRSTAAGSPRSRIHLAAMPELDDLHHASLIVD